MGVAPVPLWAPCSCSIPEGTAAAGCSLGPALAAWWGGGSLQPPPRVPGAPCPPAGPHRGGGRVPWAAGGGLPASQLHGHRTMSPLCGAGAHRAASPSPSRARPLRASSLGAQWVAGPPGGGVTKGHGWGVPVLLACSHAEGCEGCGALAAVLELPWERAGPPQEEMGVGGSPPEPGGGGRGAGGQLGHHMGRGQPRLGLGVPAMGGLRGLRERRSFLPSLRPLGGTGCSPPVPVPADGCPFSPPRTNSDSALHTSVMNPAPQDAYLGPSQGAPPPGRRGGESLPCPPSPPSYPAGGSLRPSPPAENLLFGFYFQVFWTGTRTVKVSARPGGAEPGGGGRDGMGWGRGGTLPALPSPSAPPRQSFFSKCLPSKRASTTTSTRSSPGTPRRWVPGPFPTGGGPWGSRHRRVPCPCPCLLPAGERCDTGARSLLPAPKPRPARAGGAGHKHPGRVSLLLSDFTALLVLGPAALLRSPWDPVSAGLGSPDPGFLGLGGWRMVEEVIPR